MALTKDDARKATRNLFDSAAVEVVHVMSEELLRRLCQMEEKLEGRFGGKVPEPDGLNTVSMQALIAALCSYTHAAFDGKVDVRTVLARVLVTWSEMEHGVTVVETEKAQAEQAKKAGLS